MAVRAGTKWRLAIAIMVGCLGDVALETSAADLPQLETSEAR